MIIPALVHVALLLAIGVPSDVLILSHAHGFACYGVGRAALAWVAPTPESIHRDPALRTILAVMVGAIVFAIVLGVTLHFTIEPGPLVAIPRAVAVAGGAYGALLLRRALVRRRAREDASSGAGDSEPTRTRSPLNGSFLLRYGAEASIALLLSSCTILGFNNSPNPTLQRTPIGYGDAPTGVPSWGYQGDKGAHLVILPDQVIVEGLPSRAVGHRGVQLSILPIVLETGRYSAFDFVAAFKTTGLWIWLAFVLLLRGFGRELYGLSERRSLEMAASTIFFGAVGVPLIAWPASTYAGFLKPTLSTFHNTTQLFSLLVGTAGVMLLLEAFGDRPERRRVVPVGVFLLASSFFYKPSTFTIVAPFFVGYGLLWARTLGVRTVAWLLALCLVPVGWVAYLRYQGVVSPPLDPSFSPFLLYADRAAWRFPEWIAGNGTLLATAIVVCSFAWVGLVSAPHARRLLAWRLEPASARFAIPLTIFAIGSTISLVVVEDNDRQLFGNFAWFGHAAYLIAMPVFFAWFVGLRAKPYKTICALALGLHLVAGVQHLAYFTLAAKIVPLPGEPIWTPGGERTR